ncbi:unnamed protein product [Callosobruchus maculatus]|uniref:C2H2-type domain-containing protein n=1 Tax=Callosobruchus maculatus TaxID=64391 RepID=A0A653CYL9_CALMS|nr:unnamed protein product [Callosobruchus maculatus]
MDHEMVVVERAVKVEEIKMETAGIDSEVFGGEQLIWGNTGADDNGRIGVHRIKSEPIFAKAWTNEDILEMPGEKTKLEIDLNCNQFEVAYITEDGIIKNESQYNGVNNTNSEMVSNSTLKLKVPRKQRQHLKAADRDKLSICAHCNSTFKSKQKLDEHTLKKHPDFIASVSSKIHKCAHCTYITTRKDMYARHMLEHPETADSGKLISCVHCDTTFKSKQKLDEHTLKKHPHSIESVSSKIHKCGLCIYKTTRKDVFSRHMLDHPETEDSYKHSTCIHCNAIFKHKTTLDDHIVRKHPEFIESVSSKIHECSHCSYKTVMKANLDHHMLKHPETADTYKLVTCVHCDATYKTKKNLDDHTIRKHPDSISSITSKVHKCAYCTYKTTVKGHFTEHMLKHSETTSDICILRCLHCDATFKRKTGLDNHVIRKHPHFIATVSSKMHECRHCTYKTTMKSNLAKHLLKHS